LIRPKPTRVAVPIEEEEEILYLGYESEFSKIIITNVLFSFSTSWFL